MPALSAIGRRTTVACAAGVLVVTGLVVTGLTPAWSQGSVAQGAVYQGSLDQALADKPPLLRPDMRALPAREFYLVKHDGRRYLRFSSVLANVGKGPMEVRPNNRGDCPEGQRHATQAIYRDVDESGHFKRSVDTKVAFRSAGCMVYHPSHHHWHFNAAARYQLTTRDGTVLARRPKVSFCLRDSQRVPPAWMLARHHPPFYGECTRDSHQGISIGWGDLYQNFLPGQDLKLPRHLRKGVYCLRTTADAQDRLRETDETDNVSISAVRIHRMSVHMVERSRCKAARHPRR